MRVVAGRAADEALLVREVVVRVGGVDLGDEALGGVTVVATPVVDIVLILERGDVASGRVAVSGLAPLLELGPVTGVAERGGFVVLDMRGERDQRRMGVEVGAHGSVTGFALDAFESGAARGAFRRGVADIVVEAVHVRAFVAGRNLGVPEGDRGIEAGGVAADAVEVGPVGLLKTRIGVLVTRFLPGEDDARMAVEAGLSAAPVVGVVRDAAGRTRRSRRSDRTFIAFASHEGKNNRYGEQGCEDPDPALHRLPP